MSFLIIIIIKKNGSTCWILLFSKETITLLLDKKRVLNPALTGLY